jgi:hypothetical protein
MANKLILLLIAFSMEYSSHAQINVSFDRDCLEKNSAILAQALIKSVGDDTVTEFLENGTQLLVFCEVDSLGRVFKFNKLTSKKNISKNIIDKIKTYVINSHIRFFICFEKPQRFSDCAAFKLITTDLFDENKKYLLINISFPGDLMMFYNNEKQKATEQGLTLSKYEYLLKQIKNYLLPEKQFN